MEDCLSALVVDNILTGGWVGRSFKLVLFGPIKFELEPNKAGVEPIKFDGLFELRLAVDKFGLVHEKIFLPLDGVLEGTAETDVVPVVLPVEVSCFLCGWLEGFLLGLCCGPDVPFLPLPLELFPSFLLWLAVGGRSSVSESEWKSYKLNLASRSTGSTLLFLAPLTTCWGWGLTMATAFLAFSGVALPVAGAKGDRGLKSSSISASLVLVSDIAAKAATEAVRLLTFLRGSSWSGSDFLEALEISLLDTLSSTELFLGDLCIFRPRLPCGFSAKGVKKLVKMPIGIKFQNVKFEKTETKDDAMVIFLLCETRVKRKVRHLLFTLNDKWFYRCQ